MSNCIKNYLDRLVSQQQLAWCPWQLAFISSVKMVNWMNTKEKPLAIQVDRSVASLVPAQSEKSIILQIQFDLGHKIKLQVKYR